MTPKNVEPAAINARLADVAGKVVEVIVALRGRLEPVPGGDRWRIRLPSRRTASFPTAAVIAVTPVARRVRREPA